MADLTLLLGILLAVWVVLNGEYMPDGLDQFLEIRLTVKNIILITVFGFSWHLVSALLGLYSFDRRSTATREATRIVGAVSVASLSLLLLPWFSSSGSFGYRTVLIFWLVAAPVLVVFRLSVRAAFDVILTPRQKRTVLIVGSGPRAYRLYWHLTTRPIDGCSVIGFVDSSPEFRYREINKEMVRDLKDLERILMTTVVDEVLIALPIKSCYDQIQSAIRTCANVGVNARYLADIFQYHFAEPRYELSGHSPTVALLLGPDAARLLAKRCIDILGSLVGLILFAPLMLAIALAVKLSSPGPVFFIQKRYGLRKRTFGMYKFRTMIEGSEALQVSLEALNEASGPRFKIANDPRITRVGAILRRSSLDELPQLLNVLRGEMSLVGPRPLPISDVRRFSEGWLMRRFSVRPGMTGLWQVSGRSNLDSDAWVTLDLQYIDGWSLALDCRILLKTLPAVLTGSGAT